LIRIIQTIACMCM